MSKCIFARAKKFICAKISQLLFFTTFVTVFHPKATFQQRLLSVLPPSLSSASSSTSSPFSSISVPAVKSSPSSAEETFLSYLLGFWPCLTLWSLSHFHLPRPVSWRLSQHSILYTILLDLLLSVALPCSFSISFCPSLSLSHTLAPTRTDSLPTLSESLLSVCAASLAALELRLAARGFCCCCFISSGGCTHHAAAACYCRLECPSPSILGLPGRPRQQAGLISRRHVTIGGWHARGCEECDKRGRNVAAGYHNHRLDAEFGS